jgi:hypothetical protein
MQREVLDSYTGDPYIESYQSSIPNIRVGRSPFWSEAERKRVAAQYWVSPEGEAWRLRRLGAAAVLLPVFPDLAQAVRAMDWCVLNDGSVAIAMHWLAQKNFDPYFQLLDYIMEASS